MLSKDCGNSLLAVLGFDDIVAVTGKSGLQHTTNLGFVVNHENASVVHGPSGFSMPLGVLPVSVAEPISRPSRIDAANSARRFQQETYLADLLRLQSLWGILIAIRKSLRQLGMV
jgi:hypothetical protein